MVVVLGGSSVKVVNIKEEKYHKPAVSMISLCYAERCGVKCYFLSTFNALSTSRVGRCEKYGRHNSAFLWSAKEDRSNL